MGEQGQQAAGQQQEESWHVGSAPVRDIRILGVALSGIVALSGNGLLPQLQEAGECGGGVTALFRSNGTYRVRCWNSGARRRAGAWCNQVLSGEQQLVMTHLWGKQGLQC